jgi:hypothetical protein
MLERFGMAHDDSDYCVQLGQLDVGWNEDSAPDRATDFCDFEGITN